MAKLSQNNRAESPHQTRYIKGSISDCPTTILDTNDTSALAPSPDLALKARDELRL